MAHGISVRGARRYVQNQAQADGSLAALIFPDLAVNYRHFGARKGSTPPPRSSIFLTTRKPDRDGVMRAKTGARAAAKAAFATA